MDHHGRMRPGALWDHPGRMRPGALWDHPMGECSREHCGIIPWENAPGSIMGSSRENAPGSIMGLSRENAPGRIMGSSWENAPGRIHGISVMPVQSFTHLLFFFHVALYCILLHSITHSF
jgi:hypothetical protein